MTAQDRLDQVRAAMLARGVDTPELLAVDRASFPVCGPVQEHQGRQLLQVNASWALGATDEQLAQMVAHEMMWARPPARRAFVPGRSTPAEETAPRIDPLGM